MKNRRTAFTLIELVFFCTTLGVALALAEGFYVRAYVYAGYWFALPCGVVGFLFPIGGMWFLCDYIEKKTFLL